MKESTNYIAWLIPVIAGFLTSYLITPVVINLMEKRGITREDVHKPGRPRVAYCGGIAIFISFTISLLMALLAHPELALELSIIWGVTALNFLIGIVDDIKILKGEVKTALTLIPVILVVIATFLWPKRIVLGRPRAPFVGRLRLTIIYWLLLPLAIAGPANAVNMLDVMNGIMPLTTSIALMGIIVSSLILRSWLGVIASLAMLGALLGYYPYNKYPARILNGDSGSLMVGAFLGILAVMTRQEMIILVSLFPHLLNAFLVISSIKSLKEHREIEKRPIEIRENGILAANRDRDAPLSLTRLLLLIGGPSSEKDVVKAYGFMQSVSTMLAVITGWLVSIS